MKEKHWLLKCCAWFLGIYLILAGMIMISEIPIGVAILTITFGFFIIPPIDKLIKEKIEQKVQDKFNIKEYKLLKVFVGILIFIVFHNSVPIVSNTSQNENKVSNNYSVENDENFLEPPSEMPSDNNKEEKSNFQEKITVTTDSGTYTGDVIDGMRHDSNGKYEFTNGYIYEGSFIHNQIDGNGKLTIPNLGIYEGKFSNGKRSGYGKMSFSNGDIYEGFWSNDEMSGEGTYVFANGDRYVGTFSKNMFNGNGIYTFKSSGKEYKGTWSNNNYKG